MVAFEDKIKEIDREIEKRKYKWQLKAVAWMDFDDVAQIIRLHVFHKWHLWDQSKEFLPWLNTVITNQITNLLRNLYMNVARPCVSCPANEGEDRCRIYQKQCSDCPIFKKWEKTRKTAYDVKLPVSIESRLTEINAIPEYDADIEAKADLVHLRMKEVLTPIQYRIYSYLYIDGKTDEEAATLMGYKTSEKNRSAGYKQVQNLKKIIIAKARKVINRDIY